MSITGHIGYVVAWSSITGDNVSPHTQSGIDTSTKLFGLTLM